MLARVRNVSCNLSHARGFSLMEKMRNMGENACALNVSKKHASLGYEFYFSRVEHSTEIKFIFTSRHVIFCLFYKRTNDVSDNFPKISDHFPKIFQTCSGNEHFQTFSEDYRRFPNITEDFLGGTDNVSIIQQHI